MNKEEGCVMRHFTGMLSVVFVTMQIVFVHGEVSAEGGTLTAGDLQLTLSGVGAVTQLVDRETGTDYAARKEDRALVSLLRADGIHLQPTSFEHEQGICRFAFAPGMTVAVSAKQTNGYMLFEVVDYQNETEQDIIALCWFIDSNMKHTVGETAGVIYNDEFLLGMHGLNTKTCGGHMPDFDPPTKIDNWQVGDRQKHQRSAIPTTFGSQLRCYTGDYTRKRTRRVNGTSAVEIAPLPEAAGGASSLIGSRIAFYGCRRSRFLDLLERIVLDNGLPHVTFNGVWFRRPAGRQEALRPYFEVGCFSTEEFEELVYLVRRAGSRFLYGDRPFVNFQGDYRMKNFIDDDARFKRDIVDYAEARGVGLGVHTRSSEIGRATPVADGCANMEKNLLVMKSTVLLKPMSASDQGELHVREGSLGIGSCITLMIDQEALELAPNKGKNKRAYIIARRGVQGTRAAAHKAGAAVKMLTPSVKQLYGNLHYVFNVMIPRFSELCNTYGLRKIGFDGNAAAYQNGYGSYLVNEMEDRFYRDLKNPDGMRFSGAQITPYIWHFTTDRGAAAAIECPRVVAEYSEALVRGLYYQSRNFMMRLVGTPFKSQITLREAHWICSKMAAWNSSTRITCGDLQHNPRTLEIVDILRTWMTARDVNAFTHEQRVRMARYGSNWKLTTLEPGVRWRLEEYEVADGREVLLGSEDVQAPGVTNVAPGAEITASCTVDRPEELTDMRVTEGSCATLESDGAAYVQLDLGAARAVDQVRLWHYYRDGRRYKDVVVQLSNDAAFKQNVVTVFNNDRDNSAGCGAGRDQEYAEEFRGKTILFPSQTARYVRLWSAGSNVNAGNHYAEIQVLSGAPTYPDYLDVNNICYDRNALSIKEMKKRARQEAKKDPDAAVGKGAKIRKRKGRKDESRE
jgi:hypothetical protein